MKALVFMAVLLLSAAPACAAMSVSFGPREEGTHTWRSPKRAVELDYPASWGAPEELPDGGMRLSRPGRGWFELDLIDLPEGEDLAGFSRHLIEKSKKGDWDLKLVSDLGPQTIGGKTAWVHKYRHKRKDRVYYGYNFVPENGTFGIRILVVKISRKGGEAMTKMLDSLRFAGAGAAADGAPPAEETPKDAKASVPAPEPASKTRPQLGTYNEEGSVKGRVLLKSPRDKSALPCYLSFQPLKARPGVRHGHREEDFEPAGEPVRTATDFRGRYHADLGEGHYHVEVYDAQGSAWPVLRGSFFRRSRAARLHNIRIDNRGK